MDNSKDHSPVVKRVDYSVDWKSMLLAAALITVVVYWSEIQEFVSDQISTKKQIVTPAPPVLDEQEPVTTVDTSDFGGMIVTALRHDRYQRREQAHALFQELLEQVKKQEGYNKQKAALFPRAADFYSKGDELSADKVENLYLNALAAIRQVHDDNYYDHENVYRGLEKLYLSQDRYREAIVYTRHLLDFYQRYYKEDKDALFSMVLPTTIRLGHNFLAAGENVAARTEYQRALDMNRFNDRTVPVIKKFIQKTYPQGEGSSAATTADNLKDAIEAVTMNGVFIEQIQEQDDSITVIGYADDNKMLADYMRLLQDKVGNPLLNWAKHEDRQQKQVSAFSLGIKK